MGDIGFDILSAAECSPLLHVMTSSEHDRHTRRSVDFDESRESNLITGDVNFSL